MALSNSAKTVIYIGSGAVLIYALYSIFSKPAVPVAPATVIRPATPVAATTPTSIHGSLASIFKPAAATPPATADNTVTNVPATVGQDTVTADVSTAAPVTSVAAGYGQLQTTAPALVIDPNGD